jgi:beta-lactamase class A
MSSTPSCNPQRRGLLAALAGVAAGGLRPAAAGAATRASLVEQIAALESLTGGRLGVCVLDTASGAQIAWRGDERFAMCSTFKLPLAAIVLHEADAGRLDLAEVLTYGDDDMVVHAPVTSRYLARGGMAVQALAKATQQTSDNVAANLLLRRLGGPAAFTARLRDLGDATTRLDRYEPDMNLVTDGDSRDTTTPRAMAGLIARVLGPGLLRADSHRLLLDWMRDTRTGLARLRGGLPPDWDAGDKTGTAQHPSMRNKHNDVAFVLPPQRSWVEGPIIVASYHESPGYFDDLRAEDDAIHAAVARTFVSDYARRGRRSRSAGRAG